jgi:hypothetical protein
MATPTGSKLKLTSNQVKTAPLWKKLAPLLVPVILVAAMVLLIINLESDIDNITVVNESQVEHFIDRDSMEATSEDTLPPVPVDIAFVEEQAFAEADAIEILSNSYSEKYRELSSSFTNNPKKLTISLTNSPDKYRQAVGRNNIDKMVAQGAAVRKDGITTIYIYIAKIDNLVGINSVIADIIDHELVHAFQISNSSLLADLPLWYLEGQAEYYQNPLAYGNFDISNYNDLAEIEAAFSEVDVRDQSNSDAYAIAKVFYEYLIAEVGEEELLQWLEEGIPANVDSLYRDFFRER